MNGVLALVIPKISGMLLAEMFGWLRNRRSAARKRQDARRRVQSLEDAFRELSERVEAALVGIRADGAAWRAAQTLLVRTEKLETRQTTMHQEMLAAIEAAHETARSAVNSVKGQKGGRGNKAEIEQQAQFGRDIDAALKTPQGRAALIQQVRQLGLNGGGSDDDGPGVVGDLGVGPDGE